MEKLILQQLEKDLQETSQQFAEIIQNIKSDTIKHKSKIEKEKDLNTQKGFKMAIDLVIKNITLLKERHKKAQQIEQLEQFIQLQNGYTQQDKEQKAYIQGAISALEVITNYQYTFDKDKNKAIKTS